MISTFNSALSKKEAGIRATHLFFRINESLTTMQSITRPATLLALLAILLLSKPALAKADGSSTTPTGISEASGVASSVAFIRASDLTTIDTTATSSDSEETQLQNALKSEFVRFRGLTQIQGIFLRNGKADVTPMTFRETNLRLGVRTMFDTPFNAVLQLDFSQEPNFLDAFITYAPNDRLSFKAGAFKMAQNLDFNVDPGTADFLTRSVLGRELIYPRDIGVQASLNLAKGMIWHVGLVNGDRLSSSPDDKMLLVSRLEKSAIYIGNGSLRAGVFGHIGQADLTPLGQFRQIVAQGRRLLVGVDGRFVSPDWILAAEMAYSKVETVPVTVPDIDKHSRFFGLMATAGYQFNADQQVLVRLEYFDRSHLTIDGYYTVWTAGFKQKLTELFTASVNSTFRTEQNVDITQFGVTANLQFRF